MLMLGLVRTRDCSSYGPNWPLIGLPRSQHPSLAANIAITATPGGRTPFANANLVTSAAELWCNGPWNGIFYARSTRPRLAGQNLRLLNERKLTVLHNVSWPIQERKLWVGGWCFTYTRGSAAGHFSRVGVCEPGDLQPSLQPIGVRNRLTCREKMPMPLIGRSS